MVTNSMKTLKMVYIKKKIYKALKIMLMKDTYFA